ncbi:hypothetical protein ABPG75_003181 [Micractinium tetrahymenae]
MSSSQDSVASAAAPTEGPNLGSLPDDVLSHVLALAGKQEGPALALVSRRWHTVFFSTPALWRAFSATPAEAVPPEQREEWFAARHRLQQRVGRHVQRFFSSTAWRTAGTPPEGSLRLADSLALLHPGTLQEASLQFPEGPSLDADVLPAVLTQLSLLTELVLDGPLPSDLRQLTVLSQLRALTLKQWRGEQRAPDQPPSPATFPRLERFHYNQEVSGAEVGECRFSLQPLVPHPSSPFRGSLLGDDAAPKLALYDVCQVPALQPLLDALLPAGASLAALELWQVDMEQAANWACSQLAPLTQLSLAWWAEWEEQEQAPWRALRCLLRQAPRLQGLCLVDDSLSEEGVAEVLEAVCALPALRMLDLQHNAASLPGGCSLPAASASATALTRLELRCPALVLTADDVGGTLARLRALHVLDITDVAPTSIDVVARILGLTAGLAVRLGSHVVNPKSTA